MDRTIPRSSDPRTSIAIACVGAFVAALSTSLVAVSAPVIARQLHRAPADVSWVLTAYLLAVSCLLALAGKAADVLGRKRVYLAGFGVFALGSAACAVAPTLGTLIGARVLQGIGASMLMAVGPAIVTRSVPPERRARSLGIQLAATYFGLTLGPGLGGLLSARIGWQAVFVVIAAVAVVGGLFSLKILETDDAALDFRLASLDLAGAVLFAVGLAALMISLKLTQRAGWLSSPVFGSVFVAAIALSAFTRRETRLERAQTSERKTPEPLLPLYLFRSPPFAFGVLGATLLYTVTFVLAYSLPFHLQRALHLDPAEAGALMTAQPATMAFVAPLSGIIADRWGPRVPSAAGMLAIAGGLAFVGRSAPGVGLILSLALVGVGAGLYVAPNSALIMGAAPRARQGTASAMAATARNVGMTMGIAIAASLDPTLGFRATLLVAAALAIVGALLGVVRPVNTT